MLKGSKFEKNPCPIQAKIKELGGIENAARQWMSLCRSNDINAELILLVALIPEEGDRRLVTADSRRLLDAVVSFMTNLDEEASLRKIYAEMSTCSAVDPGIVSITSESKAGPVPSRRPAAPGREAKEEAGEKGAQEARAQGTSKTGKNAANRAAPAERTGESEADTARETRGGVVELDEVVVTFRLASIRENSVIFALFKEGGELRHYKKPRATLEGSHLDLLEIFVYETCRNPAGVKMSGEGDKEFNPVPSVKVIDSGGYVCFDLLFGLAQVAITRPGNKLFPFIWRLTESGVVRFDPIVEMNRSVLPLEALNLDDWVHRVFKREGQVGDIRGNMCPKHCCLG
jgi:hypothetical protein